jgi:hypothetical protein
MQISRERRKSERRSPQSESLEVQKKEDEASYGLTDFRGLSDSPYSALYNVSDILFIPCAYGVGLKLNLVSNLPESKI